MIVFLNGRFVPEEQAVVSAFDRGFLYGDGLFETMRVRNGRPFRWEDHFERLRHGASYLRLTLPYASESLLAIALELAARNESPDAVLRLTISRGMGVRGYSPRGAERPSAVMSLHPPPDAGQVARGIRLTTSSLRLPANDALARFKTCNKLPQIIARTEADEAGADEALLLDTEGHVAETSSGNVFWVEDGSVYTPPLTCGVLPGVTRKVVFELCAESGLEVREASAAPQQLQRADGVFLSLSSAGVVDCVSLDGQGLNRSEIVSGIAFAYGRTLILETQG